MVVISKIEVLFIIGNLVIIFPIASKHQYSTYVHLICASPKTDFTVNHVKYLIVKQLVKSADDEGSGHYVIFS